MLRKTLTAALALGVALLGPAGSYADTNSNMNSFWNSSLSASNVTGPTAYQGQAAGYYTLGNVAMRSQQDTYSVGSIQLPSVRAGCGGIDIFTGGFSFISSDQLVAMLKATASSAVSYAFLLAVKSLSPMIADQMEALSKVAQEINQYNMSSCEAGQALVGSLWGKHDAASRQICQDLGASNGFYSDHIKSRHGCGAKGELNSVLASASADQKKAVIPVNKNIAWEAIKQHPLMASDMQLAQVFMTLTGTAILRCPTSGDGGCVWDVLEPQAIDDGVITKLLDGGVMKVHACDTTTECLNPNKFTTNYTIGTTSQPAFRKRVETVLTSIVTKIRNREALNTTEQDFLRMASLPVYKMASVFAAQQGSFASNQMTQYADVIALDIVYGWLENSLQRVAEGSANLTGVDPKQLELWRESLADVRQMIVLKQNSLNTRATALDAMIQRTMQAEQVLAGRMGSRVGDALAFSASLGPN